MAEYAYTDILVSTAWVAEHRHDPHVRVVESDEDILLYDVGHIPGAIKVDWQSELQHQVVRDYIDRDAFGWLIGSKGIGQDQTVVFYGDRNNWWACYAFWVFKMYGPWGLPHHERWAAEMARRGSGDDARTTYVCSGYLYSERTESAYPRLPAGCAGTHAGAQTAH